MRRGSALLAAIALAAVAASHARGAQPTSVYVLGSLMSEEEESEPITTACRAELAGLTTIDYACVVVDRSPLNSLYCGGEPKDHPADRLCSISREPARSRLIPSAKSSPAFAVRPQVRRGALRAD